MKKYFLLIPFFISFNPVFAPSHPEYFEIDNPSSYILQIDDHVYDIQYNINANVLAMAIDQELTSLLIGIEDTKDSDFVIDLHHELINAQNNAFAVLVNGVEIDYEIISDSDSSTLSFFVPEGTEEIEIIGTHTIPEFHLIVFVLIVTVGMIVIFSRLGKLPLMS